ncbi:MAG: sigma-54 dependent transcriptional regulator [Pseudomonadales bacterium]|nr:sigma-54 dependent transcriptional regulator [Pseudomonadales bacterium]
MSNSTGQGSVLIVDDDHDVLLTAELLLKNYYRSVRGITNPSDMAPIFDQEDVDVVLLDMNFTRGFTTGEEGFYWLAKIKALSPHTQIIMATAYGEIDLAVEAIKQGAADFLVKPWDNEKLISTVNTCLKLSHSQQKIHQLESTQRALNDSLQSGFGELIGESPAMKKVTELIDKVAATDASVLILGENGTGKELVARAIHNKSSRQESALISVDLGAISETLFESEMFGHKKGAFTDAREDRAGRFEVANGGTLFLDEIGNLSLTLQAKLLGVLENRQVTRVGSDRPVDIDIRLICATNRPIDELNNEELFRPDLLYRINTVEVTLPPLRERKGDIALLANHYAELYANKYHKTALEIPESELHKLESYHWPGNIRELQHALERAVIISDGSWLMGDDILISKQDRGNGEKELNIAKLEKQAIQQAISQFDGNLTKVAKALGLGRTTLYRKMEKYDLSD